MNLQSARVRGTEKKFSSLEVRYPALTIRNLNPYESKVFYEFLPNNRFVNPNLFIKPVPVPVPHTCTYLYLPSCYRGFQAYKAIKRSLLETLGTRGNTKETCTCILVPVPVPVYLYLYLVPRYPCSACTCILVPRYPSAMLILAPVGHLRWRTTTPLNDAT
jgi:hypothetical protein